MKGIKDSLSNLLINIYFYLCETNKNQNQMYLEVLNSQIEYWNNELKKRKKDKSCSDFKINLAQRKLNQCKLDKQNYLTNKN